MLVEREYSEVGVGTSNDKDKEQQAHLLELSDPQVVPLELLLECRVLLSKNLHQVRVVSVLQRRAVRVLEGRGGGGGGGGGRRGEEGEEERRGERRGREGRGGGEEERGGEGKGGEGRERRGEREKTNMTIQVSHVCRQRLLVHVYMCNTKTSLTMWTTKLILNAHQLVWHTNTNYANDSGQNRLKYALHMLHMASQATSHLQ